ncbi:hypothetical protein ANO11243_033210 [Dothideomycetidae sp. 11243]|nr:hypothetical protein ANO11243_033210 [fungal sp. No.11243]
MATVGDPIPDSAPNSASVGGNAGTDFIRFQMIVFDNNRAKEFMDRFASERLQEARPIERRRISLQQSDIATRIKYTEGNYDISDYSYAVDLIRDFVINAPIADGQITISKDHYLIVIRSAVAQIMFDPTLESLDLSHPERNMTSTADEKAFAILAILVDASEAALAEDNQKNTPRDRSESLKLARDMPFDTIARADNFAEFKEWLQECFESANWIIPDGEDRVAPRRPAQDTLVCKKGCCHAILILQAVYRTIELKFGQAKWRPGLVNRCWFEDTPAVPAMEAE